jgi:predicted TIM-barrel fold metal-dependent hydrolase
VNAWFPRRQFLTGLAAIEASALVHRAAAQTPNSPVIDCHHHFLSPASTSKRLPRKKADTAQSTNIIQMEGLKAVVDPSHIVFGTDFPFNDATRHLAGLEKCGFTSAELQAIRWDNALKLFHDLSCSGGL